MSERTFGFKINISISKRYCRLCKTLFPIGTTYITAVLIGKSHKYCPSCSVKMLKQAMTKYPDNTYLQKLYLKIKLS